MHAEELRLKYALVDEVRYDSGEGQLRQVRALWAAQPHIQGDRVRDLLYIVAVTQDARGLKNVHL
jgi:hypothetical protein